MAVPLLFDEVEEGGDGGREQEDFPPWRRAEESLVGVDPEKAFRCDVCDINSQGESARGFLQEDGEEGCKKCGEEGVDPIVEPTAP